MDPRIEIEIREADKAIQTTLSSYADFIEYSKEGNERVGNHLKANEQAQENKLGKLENKIAEKQKIVDYLEGQALEAESVLNLHRSEHEKLHVDYLRKAKEINELQVPDLNEVTEERNKLKDAISTLKRSISILINISKVKLDITETEKIKGCILKDNESIPFQFPKDTDPFKRVNLLWDMI